MEILDASLPSNKWDLDSVPGKRKGSKNLN